MKSLDEEKDAGGQYAVRYWTKLVKEENKPKWE